MNETISTHIYSMDSYIVPQYSRIAHWKLEIRRVLTMDIGRMPWCVSIIVYSIAVYLYIQLRISFSNFMHLAW
jgi:hypothetical protein